MHIARRGRRSCLVAGSGCEPRSGQPDKQLLSALARTLAIPPAARLALAGLARTLDEAGNTRAAIERYQEALAGYERGGAESVYSIEILRALARLLEEEGRSSEARSYLERAVHLEEQMQSSRLERWENESGGMNRPEVRYLSPEANSPVDGKQVTLTVALAAPLPLAR